MQQPQIGVIEDIIANANLDTIKITFLCETVDKNVSISTTSNYDKK